MKKFLRIFAIIIVTLLLVYFFGPVPEEPVFIRPSLDLPSDLQELDRFVIDRESKILYLKSGNGAEIIWNNDQIQKTEYSVVYLHGFSASHEEGNGIHEAFSSRYGANLYKARLQHHGIEGGENNMLKMTAEGLYETAIKAIEIGKRLGDKVIVISCSTGSTLALLAASEKEEIHALFNYSANVDVFDPSAFLITMPWGLQIAKYLEGSDHRSWEAEDYQKDYWTTRYRYEAIQEMILLLQNSMTEEKFNAINIPVFNCYWPDDEVISVPRLIEMHEQLGTQEGKKRLVSIDNAGTHMMVSDYFSQNLNLIQTETFSFAEEVLGMKSL